MKKTIRYFLLFCALLSVRVFAQNDGENYANARSSRLKTAVYGSVVRPETSDTINVISAKAHTGINNSADAYRSFDVSPAYPNPASATASIDYTIPEGINGKLLLRNLAGSIVREVILDRSEGRIVLSTNDLKDGLYFYSVLLNNRVGVTKKLMIRH